MGWGGLCTKSAVILNGSPDMDENTFKLVIVSFQIQSAGVQRAKTTHVNVPILLELTVCYISLILEMTKYSLWKSTCVFSLFPNLALLPLQLSESQPSLRETGDLRAQGEVYVVAFAT